MLKDKKISIIGSGNMGEALVSGLITSGSSNPENIICTDIRMNKLESVAKKYGVVTLTENIKAVEFSDIIIYAVKPQIIASVLKETASCLDMSKLIISIAAGVPLAAIESCLKKGITSYSRYAQYCSICKRERIGDCGRGKCYQGRH